MRDIKFRAWTGSKMEHNVMAGWLGAFYVQGIDAKDSASMSPSNTVFPEQTPLMQYTGLKDKNGVEIYEGDLMQWIDWEQELTERPDIYRVDWLDKEARFSLNCFRDGRHLDPKEDMLQLDDQFEVIGNIYENPRLLEK
ncbi:YopX family protein [Pseudarthrobacter sp. H2]|uniref:YopX family protein n=1 Tax=Pseudarthrobacter sp. H2 TaxID=3418415 RepID=UPI003CE81AC6